MDCRRLPKFANPCRLVIESFKGWRQLFLALRAGRLPDRSEVASGCLDDRSRGGRVADVPWFRGMAAP